MRYLVGLSQEESGWVAQRLGPVHEYIQADQEKAVEAIDADRTSSAGDAHGAGGDQIKPGIPRPGADWFQQESLTDAAESLRQYALANRLVTADVIDPETAGSVETRLIAETNAGQLEILLIGEGYDD